MRCLYLAYISCLIFAADALSGSNNDTKFVAGVRSKLFGKCYDNCLTQRDALAKAKGAEEICRRADEYMQCYLVDKACNTSSGFNNLTKLGDELKKTFCGNTNPAPETTKGPRTTTPKATPAPITTESPTGPNLTVKPIDGTISTVKPADESTKETNSTFKPIDESTNKTSNSSAPQSEVNHNRRKRQTDGTINEAVKGLLSQKMDCGSEMCTDKQTKMFSPNPQTINCTLLEVYGTCLEQSCPWMNEDVQTTKHQCGAANRIFLSSTVLLVGILLRFLA